MQCPSCNTPSHRSICAKCIALRQSNHRKQLAQLKNSLSTLHLRAKQALPALQAARHDSADEFQLRNALREAVEAATTLKRKNETQTAALNDRKLAIKQRREALARAQSLLEIAQSSNNDSPFLTQEPTPLASMATVKRSMADLEIQLGATAENLLETRATLALGVLDIFQIDPGGNDKPPTVLGYRLPPLIDEMKNHPAHEINAALSFSAHCIRQLTFYLGVKLPFLITIGPKVSLRAHEETHLAPGLAWNERWLRKYQLILPSHSKLSAYDPSPSTSDKPVSSTLLTFQTAYAMLLYDAAYLLRTQLPSTFPQHVQDVFKIPELAQTSIISLLAYLPQCIPQKGQLSSGLGHQSHSVSTNNLPDLSFTSPADNKEIIDFSALLHAITSIRPTTAAQSQLKEAISPTPSMISRSLRSKTKERREMPIERFEAASRTVEDDWDYVDVKRK